MSETEERIRAFVYGLSADACREELFKAYLHMECCREVLRGEDCEPVEMKDNGESSDLELYYQCRKVASELAYLNDIVSRHGEELEDEDEYGEGE